MQIILDIVKKTSQLTELKKSIIQNDLHCSTDDKHSSNNDKHYSTDDKYLSDYKLSAAAERARNALLKDSELVSEKMKNIT